MANLVWRYFKYTWNRSKFQYILYLLQECRRIGIALSGAILNFHPGPGEWVSSDAATYISCLHKFLFESVALVLKIDTTYLHFQCNYCFVIIILLTPLHHNIISQLPSIQI